MCTFCMKNLLCYLQIWHRSLNVQSKRHVFRKIHLCIRSRIVPNSGEIGSVVDYIQYIVFDEVAAASFVSNLVRLTKPGVN